MNIPSPLCDPIKKIVFVFSGLGAQWPNMGAGLLKENVFYQKLLECDQFFRQYTDRSVIIDIAAKDSVARMQELEIAHRCTFSVQAGLTALLEYWGLLPDAVLGHSAGEVIAAYTAGVLSLKDAVKVIWHHCLLIQKAKGKGKMLFMGLPVQAVEDILKTHPKLSLAAVNGPKSTVLSGGDELEEIKAELEEKGIFCRLLNMNLGFHSPQVEPHLAEFKAALQDIQVKPANIPIYSSYHGLQSQDQHDFNGEYWANHIRYPVQFASVVDEMIRDGYTGFIEISPHSVLSNAIHECFEAYQTRDYFVLGTLKAKEEEKTELFKMLAMLSHSASHRIHWDQLNAEEQDKIQYLAASLKESHIESEFREKLQHAPPGERNTLLIELIQTCIHEVSEGTLAIPEFFDLNQGFLELGMTSVMAVRFKRFLESALNISIPSTIIFDYPSPKALIEYLNTQLFDPLSVKPQALNKKKISVDPGEPIAIIGMGCRFPGCADNLDLFWDLLIKGKDAVTEVPSVRWNMDDYYDPDPDAPGKSYTRRGAFVSDTYLYDFDALFFRIPPKEAEALDPQQRMMLEAAWEAIENAGIPMERLHKEPVGVYVGLSTDDYKGAHLFSHDFNRMNAYSATGSMYSAASGRLSYFLNLHGPNFPVDTACSSALVAIHTACQSLRNRECAMALAGGVNAMVSPNLFVYFSKLGALSQNGICSAFDEVANGYVRGEGCGIVMLKRLSDALSDGDRIWAIIRGSALNHDGASSSFTAPNGRAQQEVISSALENAGLSPDEIDYIEAHGTGTALGDPIELGALGSVYGERANGPLYLSSVKANIGHLEAAAGVASLIKAVLVLNHKMIPRQIHFNHPNPLVSWDNLPISIPREQMSWTEHERPLRAGISSFGFSGTNAHVIIEDVQSLRKQRHRSSIQRPLHILTFSAKNSEAVQEYASRYQKYLDQHETGELADICYTANTGRTHFDHRVALIGESKEEIKKKLTSHSSLITSHSSPLVFLFTGQGSQYPGMGRGLFETQPVFREALSQCDGLFEEYLERSIIDLLYLQENADSLLNQTFFTQPIIFSVEYALSQVWAYWGIHPSVVLGHSIGEYVAACLAGVFSLEDAIKLVAARGRLIQSVSETGIMGAVFTNEKRVLDEIEPYKDKVSIAAVNAPESVVISGDARSVDTILSRFKDQGIKSRVLKVSHAFHSPMMDPILEGFTSIASKVSYAEPSLSIISNVTGQKVSPGEMVSPEYWTRHIREGVRFYDSMKTLDQEGYKLFLEIGSTRTLTSLGRQCLPENQGLWLASLRKGHDDWRQILDALSQLYLHGANIDWEGFDRPYSREKVSIPSYPFQRRRFWMNPVKEDVKTLAFASDSFIGQKITSPVMEDAFIFQSVFNEDSPVFLKEHIVFDTLISPAAAHLSMMISALNASFDQKECLIEDVNFLEPLIIQEDRTVQVILENSSRFQIVSKAESKWLTHCEGNWKAQIQVPAFDLQGSRYINEIRSRSSNQMDGKAFYETFNRLGYQLGEGFQCIESAWTEKNEALTRVQVKRAGDAFIVYPGLMDSILQSLVFGDMDCLDQMLHTQKVLIPFALSRLVFYGKDMGKSLWCHARTKARNDVIEADIRVWNEAQERVMDIKGFVVKLTDQATLLKSLGSQESLRNVLYEVQWLPLELSHSLPSPKEIEAKIMSQVPGIMAQKGLKAYGELLDHLEEVSVSYVFEAFQQMGEDFQKRNSYFSTQEMADALGIVSQHHGLLNRVLEILAEENILRRYNGYWEAVSIPVLKDSQTYIRYLFEHYPEAHAELTLLQRCGEGLAKSLQGECDPLQLLFPGGDMTHASQFYQNSPGLQIVNALTQKTFESVLEKLPKNQEVRILEIGAGTGGTTAYLLPLLAEHKVQYVFTDVSNLFTAQAREKFQAYPFVSYQVLDIEQNPENQGFITHHFDMILAANVLHATEDLRQTLKHIRQLLAPEGLLILLEGTERLRWIDLIFGLMEGWWRFKDHALRPSYPLISFSQWKKILTEGGFDEALNICPADHSLLHQAIILARNTKIENARTWVLLCDDQGVGKNLANRLSEKGDRCISVFLGNSYEQISSDAFKLNPFQESDFETFFKAIETPEIQGILHLWHLEKDIYFESPLNLIHAVIQTGFKSLPRIWFITWGAQGELFDISGLYQSSVWGMAKVIRLEYPELNCRCLDLANESLSTADEILFQEIESGNAEPFVDFRGKTGYVPRLKAYIDEENQEPLQFSKQGVYLITGGLGGLGLLMARWMAEQGAGHIALLSRSGLRENVREALKAIEDAGAEVGVFSADVIHKDQLAHALTEIEKNHGKIRGVIHAAGILDDGMLIQQNRERFKAVMEPKIMGAWHLHELTQNHSLDFFILFSSAASLLGNQAQSNYAAANAFLDALAHYRRNLGLPGTSINWGAWEKIGMVGSRTSAQEKRLSDQGFANMTEAIGLKVMEEAISKGPVQLGAVICDWQKYIGQHENQAEFFSELVQTKASVKYETLEKKDKKETECSDFMTQLQQIPASEKNAFLMDFIQKKASDTIGFDSSRQLDLDIPLMDQGFDSLMAVDLRNLLGKALNTALPVTLLFNYPSIREMTNYLEKNLIPQFPSSEEKGDSSVEPEIMPPISGESVLEEIENLLD